MADQHTVLGIDVGGTGIKAALVDVRSGELLTEKLRILTPKPADPPSVANVIREAIHTLDYAGPVGCGFPSVIADNKVMTATNMDASWIQLDLANYLSKETGQPFYVLNDADAAGLGEVHFGAARGCQGLVIMITIGTGVGSGMFFEGKLIPNSEFGFLPIKGGIAEIRVSNRARVKGHLSWMVFGRRLQEYLQLIERLFRPEMIVLGGGVSKKFDLYKSFLNIDTPLLPAGLQNNAGCIGAAWFAYQKHEASNN
jgi:polyphosphate glucokinase